MDESQDRSLWKTVKARLSLAHRILRTHYIQPATALFRVFELEVVIRHIKGNGRGLDLGCGDGTIAALALPGPPAIRWAGLDIDPLDVSLAARRGPYEGVAVASGTQMPLADNTIDLAFSNCVLEHIEDLDGVLREVHRVLREGGRLAFTVPGAAMCTGLFWYRVLRRLGFRKTADGYVEHFNRRMTIYHCLSPETWSERLEAAGFRMDRAAGYLSRRSTACWETLSNCTGGLAYLLARGRAKPREIQHAAGVVRRQWPWLGTVAFLLLLPALLFTATERKLRSPTCLYIEAVKESD